MKIEGNNAAISEIHKKFIFIFLILVLVFASLIPVAYAHCPLCTAAVGAAAISAKYFGLDLTIIGLLIGAFAVSSGLWISLKIRQYFKLQLPIIVLASYLLTIIPLLYLLDDRIYLPILFLGPEGSIFNKVYWINKIFLGSVLGCIITLLAYFVHVKIKNLNGKVLFPFQGIVLTLIFLFISGLSLYFLFR